MRETPDSHPFFFPAANVAFAVTLILVGGASGAVATGIGSGSDAYDALIPVLLAVVIALPGRLQGSISRNYRRFLIVVGMVVTALSLVLLRLGAPTDGWHLFGLGLGILVTAPLTGAGTEQIANEHIEGG